jgi:hypothetical protein
MPQTLIAADHETRQRGLVVEVHPEMIAEPTERDVRDLCRRIFDRNVYAALLVTPQTTIVIRDLLTELSFSTNRYDVQRFSTARLFAQARLGAPRPGEAFYAQVQRWLAVVGTAWHDALLPEAIDAMVPEIVGHLVDAELETFDDVLEPRHAA